MTNKPMLSVERELLERIAKPLKMLSDKPFRTKAILELRALLDADKVNSREMGLMQYVEAHPIKPAAQHQGDLVGYVSPAGLAGAKSGKTAMFRSCVVGVYTIPLYAKQSAPVADPDCDHCCGAGHNPFGEKCGCVKSA